MSLESERTTGSELGSLESCLVGGDPEQRSRERQVRSRALAISIATQSAIVTAIVLIPLLAKPSRIAATIVPVPRYYTRLERRTQDVPRSHEPMQRTAGRSWDFRSIPATVVTHDPKPIDDQLPVIEGGIPMPLGSIPMVDARRGPTPPPNTRTEVDQPKIVHRTQLDPAMLVHRVEPVYPALMKQIHRSGQVQVRAIIGTDGTIQSLQVVGGDPGFFQSALEAVRQWRYKPTVLNGNPVEVDTFIAVIYNISR